MTILVRPGLFSMGSLRVSLIGGPSEESPFKTMIRAMDNTLNFRAD